MKDTVYYDAAKVAKYQSNNAYDYASQFDLPEYSWFDIVSKWFNKLLNSIFNGKFNENITTPLLIIIFLAILFAFLFFLYKKRPELFVHTSKAKTLKHDYEEENINKIDFIKEIETALKNRDYRLAIRLKYLQTLRILTDSQLVEWELYKTPTDYIHELRNNNLRPVMRLLTNRFLEVRYGNYAASEDLYYEMQNYQNLLQKGESQ